jgi:hypothetical protein
MGKKLQPKWNTPITATLRWPQVQPLWPLAARSTCGCVGQYRNNRGARTDIIPRNPRHCASRVDQEPVSFSTTWQHCGRTRSVLHILYCLPYRLTPLDPFPSLSVRRPVGSFTVARASPGSMRENNIAPSPPSLPQAGPPSTLRHSRRHASPADSRLWHPGGGTGRSSLR